MKSAVLIMFLKIVCQKCKESCGKNVNMSVRLAKHFIHVHCTCKDAIQCRPWAPPPLRILLANRFKYFYLFGILGTNNYIWSAGFFLFRKLKTPFWAKKQKRSELWRGSIFHARLL